jgi:putative heme iron utilization protein
MPRKPKKPKPESPNPSKQDHAKFVRDSRLLMRRARVAMVSTALKSGDGWPYGSLVSVAFDSDLSPLMLFSNLSDHTRNLAVDPRASLLFEETSRLKNPQTGPRVSVLGRITKTSDQRHQRRFLALHPEAALYAGFGDFGFFRMQIERVHFVGGFAKAVWFKAPDIVADAKAATAVAKAEKGVLAHMNEDHADAIDHYANALLGRAGSGWRMTGIDPDGFDLRLGGRTARLEFDRLIGNRKAIREELVRLARLD